MEYLEITRKQLAGFRRKGLKGTMVGKGLWVFLVDDLLDFVKTNTESVTLTKGS